MSEAIRSIVDEAVVALASLVDAASDDQRLMGLLATLGWEPASAPQPLRDLAAAGASLMATIGADDADVSVAGALAAVKQLVDALNAIGSLSDAAFPGGIDVAQFKTTIGRDLLDFLVAEHLLCNHYKLGGLLRLAGIIRLTHEPAAGLRRPFLRRRVAWSTLGTLLTDPVSGFQQAFGWSTQAPELTQAVGTLGSLLEQFGVRFRYFAPTGDFLAFVLGGAAPPLDPPLGIDLLLSDPTGGIDTPGGLRLVVRPPTAARGQAISLMPYAPTALVQSVALGDGVSLSIQGDADFTKGVALTVAPGHPPSLDAGFLGGTTALPADIRVSIDVAPSSAGPAIAVGSPTGSHLSVQGLRVGAGAARSASGELDAFVTLDLDRASIVIKPEPNEGDSFLESLIGDGIAAELSLGAELSARRGFHLKGSGSLTESYPVALNIGVADLQAISVGVRPTSQGVDFEIGASIRGNLGPVAVTLDGVGFRLATRFPDPPTGNLGPIDVGFGFKPPEGVGLSVDTHGLLTGGGFLEFDPVQGMYAGVMQLAFQDAITLTAFGIITTKLPDGRPGYSLLIFITADGFQPVPLGFGFVLQSIGGMVGVHRTFDEQVLKAGLKTDTLGTLLFPRDPVRNASALIQALATAFPAQRGSYLVGLLARITWFTPTLVTIDLALILELGVRTRLLVLARVSALLPTRDNDLVRLTLDAIGVVDFDASTLAIDAVLVDSRLVHQFPITGSAALRARWAGQEDFVLAVGGLNPRFAAPAGFPTLERVTIALCSGTNPRLVCDAYLAITANTVQFGARASLYAEAVGFSITGDVGFDALITLVPPHFLVDFHASVQLKRGSHNLFKLTVDGTLEGPLPLRIAAKAKFEILWFSYTVHFDFTLTAGDVARVVVPAVSLVTELAKALADPANWSTQLPAGLAHGVAFAPLAAGSGGTTVLDPLGQLVVKQQVAPLNTAREVTTFGGVPVAGDRRFRVAATLNGLGTATPVAGPFAPARYFAMSDDAKLAAPSFEAMDAGLALGDPTATYDASGIVAAPVSYLPITLNPLPTGTTTPTTPTAPAAPTPLPLTPARYALPVEAFTTQRPTGAAARVPARRVGRARFRNPTAAPAATVAPPRWRIVQVSDGAVAPLDPAITTWSDYRDALDTLNRGGARWQMVPAHELTA